jgi:hypothetical protein
MQNPVLSNNVSENLNSNNNNNNNININDGNLF